MRQKKMNSNGGKEVEKIRETNGIAKLAITHICVFIRKGAGDYEILGFESFERDVYREGYIRKERLRGLVRNNGKRG